MKHHNKDNCLKIKIGHQHNVLGIIHYKHGKVAISGHKAKIRFLLHHLKTKNQTTEQLIHSLPYTLRGHTWAHIIK